MRKPLEKESAAPGVRDGSSLETSIPGNAWKHTTDAADLTRQKRWRLANPDAYRAHVAVAGALRRGILTRPEACEKCGATDKRLDGHHPNYRDRLRIKWWCRSCHIRHHGRLRKAGRDG